MVDPLQDTPEPKCCLEGAPLFWNCTAELVTFPVAAAIGLDVLFTSGASLAFTGATARRQTAKQ